MGHCAQCSRAIPVLPPLDIAQQGYTGVTPTAHSTAGLYLSYPHCTVREPLNIYGMILGEEGEKLEDAALHR